MIDPFVLLTPLLMLGVIALVRFVGCNQLLGLDQTATALPPVVNRDPVVGDQKVTLKWDYGPGDATSFVVWFHELNVGDYIVNQDAQINFDTTPGQPQHGTALITNLPNGSTFFFKVIAHKANSSSVLPQTMAVEVTPGVTAFLSFTNPGGIRNDFAGWVGMAVQMDGDAIATQLGRLVVANNVRMHDIKIIDPGDNNKLLGLVTVNMPAGPIGTFAYQPLSPPVPLMQNRLYYFITHEEMGGDNFLDIMPVDTTGIGHIIAGVYSYDTAPDDYLFLGSSANQTYGPVNFTY